MAALLASPCALRPGRDLQPPAPSVQLRLLAAPPPPRAAAARWRCPRPVQVAAAAAERAPSPRRRSGGGGGGGGSGGGGASQGRGRVRRPGAKPDADTQLRLNKAIAAAGVASRRGADDLIFEGKVRVNGAVVTEPGRQVDLRKDKVWGSSRASGVGVGAVVEQQAARQAAACCACIRRCCVSRQPRCLVCPAAPRTSLPASSAPSSPRAVQPPPRARPPAQVSVNGREISAAAAQRKFYFALNKPKGFVCSNKSEHEDGGEGRLVVSLFDDWIARWRQRQARLARGGGGGDRGSGGGGATAVPPRLFTVGRLDVQSVGLIFVTNDGDWAHK